MTIATPPAQGNGIRFFKDLPGPQDGPQVRP